MKFKINQEPAVVGAAVAAILNDVVLIVFSHNLTPSIQGLIATVVTGAAGLFIRSRVSPSTTR